MGGRVLAELEAFWLIVPVETLADHVSIEMLHYVFDTFVSDARCECSRRFMRDQIAKNQSLNLRV